MNNPAIRSNPALAQNAKVLKINVPKNFAARMKDEGYTGFGGYGKPTMTEIELTDYQRHLINQLMRKSCEEI